MEAAGEAGIPFVVLDRPNPIGGSLVQGNVLDPVFATFVGMYPVPMRHGMTVGELARLFVREFGVEVELHVVPAAGWRRSMWFDQTRLPWVPPSPNMPDLESATHYPGSCLFEGTNLSIGRGTDRAFQQIGAPWLDGEALAARLNEYALVGVRFEPVAFTPVSPSDERFGGATVHGVRFVVTDRERYDPTLAGVAALLEARDLAGERWEWKTEHFDRLAGTDRLRSAIDARRPLEEIVSGWAAERESFMEMRSRVLLYPE
ncbi:MAG: exo-beta-N-acetylmuramidase NamZ family protein, partial [Gemmatimonadota bacterium]